MAEDIRSVFPPKPDNRPPVNQVAYFSDTRKPVTLTPPLNEGFNALNKNVADRIGLVQEQAYKDNSPLYKTVDRATSVAQFLSKVPGLPGNPISSVVNTFAPKLIGGAGRTLKDRLVSDYRKAEIDPRIKQVEDKLTLSNTADPAALDRLNQIDKGLASVGLHQYETLDGGLGFDVENPENVNWFGGASKQNAATPPLIKQEEYAKRFSEIYAGTDPALKQKVLDGLKNNPELTPYVNDLNKAIPEIENKLKEHNFAITEQGQVVNTTTNQFFGKIGDFFKNNWPLFAGVTGVGVFLAALNSLSDNDDADDDDKKVVIDNNKQPARRSFLEPSSEYGGYTAPVKTSMVKKAALLPFLLKGNAFNTTRDFAINSMFEKSKKEKQQEFTEEELYNLIVDAEFKQKIQNKQFRDRLVRILNDSGVIET